MNSGLKDKYSNYYYINYKTFFRIWQTAYIVELTSSLINLGNQ
jgi:hypothetical protein